LPNESIDVVGTFAASVTAFVSERLVQVPSATSSVIPASIQCRFYRFVATAAEDVPLIIAGVEKVFFEAAVVRDCEARGAPDFLVTDVERRMAPVANGIIRHGISDQACAVDGRRAELAALPK
jgi:hypothetical protein